MTSRQTNRSRVLRRVGAVITAAVAVGAVATSAGVSAKKPAAPTIGGTLKVAMRDTIPKYCTGDNAAGSALMAQRTIYDTLFEKTKGGDLVGMLAESATPSQDLKTWTIKIRKAPDGGFIKFHDGTNMDADAVAYNINSARGARLGKLYLLGTSVTFQANIVSATGSVGGDTVVIALARPQNDLTSTLYASGRFVIRGKAQLDSETTCGTFPIGTGPFKVKAGYTWEKDNLTVVKNTDYWRKDAKGVQLPYLDQIDFKNIKEANTAKNAILTGGYHVVQMSGATDGTFIKRLRLEKKKLTEFKTPYEYYPSIWMNQVIEPAFKKLSCRQAVSYGLDRKEYVKRRGSGEMRAATSIVGPTSVMYTTSGFLQYNLKKAQDAFKTCLTEAGVTSIDIALPADKSNNSFLNSKEVARQLKKVGFNATVATQQDSTDIITTALNPTGNKYKMINILLLEGTDVGFNAPFLLSNGFDAGNSNSLGNFYKGTLGQILNLSRHSDTKVDELFWEARKIAPKSNGQLDMKASGPAFKAATKYIQEQNIITSLSHQYVSIFTTKKVGGVGTLKTPGGKTPRVVTNWGIQYAGVYLNK